MVVSHGIEPSAASLAGTGVGMGMLGCFTLKRETRCRDALPAGDHGYRSDSATPDSPESVDTFLGVPSLALVPQASGR